MLYLQFFNQWPEGDLHNIVFEQSWRLGKAERSAGWSLFSKPQLFTPQSARHPGVEDQKCHCSLSSKYYLKIHTTIIMSNISRVKFTFFFCHYRQRKLGKKTTGLLLIFIIWTLFLVLNAAIKMERSLDRVICK